MHLGIDFDNTIARYDELFHTLAVEHSLIDAAMTADKTTIRDHLRATGREDDWTQLQGLAYGPQITRAQPFPGVLDFFRRAAAAGIDTQIVSHKTKTPYQGKPHDLHAAARSFLALHHIDVPAHLEVTKDAKLARIAALNRSHFIDDLPELLTQDDFPSGVKRLLFDPNDIHPDDKRYQRFTSWNQLSATLLISDEV